VIPAEYTRRPDRATRSWQNLQSRDAFPRTSSAIAIGPFFLRAEGVLQDAGLHTVMLSQN